MEVFIDDPTRAVFVLTDDVREAYTLGLHFKEDHPDLAVWSLYCRPSSDRLLGERLYRRERVEGLRTLAQAIRKGPECTHSCPRHRPLPKQELDYCGGTKMTGEGCQR